MRLRGMRHSGMRRLVVEQLESRWLLSQLTGTSAWDTLAETPRGGVICGTTPRATPEQFAARPTSALPAVRRG